MIKKPRRPTFQDIVAQVKAKGEARSYDRIQDLLSRPTQDQALGEVTALALQFYGGLNGGSTDHSRGIDIALAAALSSGSREDWSQVRKAYLERRKVGSANGKRGCDPTSQLAMAAAMPCIAGTHEGLPYLRTVRINSIYASLATLSPLLHQHLCKHYGHEAEYQGPSQAPRTRQEKKEY